MDQGICKGCGRPILWAVNESTDRPIPLDPRAPVFEQDGQVVRQTKLAWVSHFATCPKANDFSASNKQERLL